MEIEHIHFAKWDDIIKPTTTAGYLQVIINRDLWFPFFFDSDGMPNLSGPIGENSLMARVLLSEENLNDYYNEEYFTEMFRKEYNNGNMYYRFMIESAKLKHKGEIKFGIAAVSDFVDESYSVYKLDDIMFTLIQQITLLSMIYYYFYDESDRLNKSELFEKTAIVLKDYGFLPKNRIDILNESKGVWAIKNVKKEDYCKFFLDFRINTFTVLIDISGKFDKNVRAFCKNADEEANLIMVSLYDYAQWVIDHDK